MVCNIFFWPDFYLFQFALEGYLCLGTCHFQYELKDMHLASGMNDGGAYGGLYFLWMTFDWLQKCYVLVHKVILKTTSRAMVI